MVLFAEKGVKEGQEITWSYADSYRSNRKAMRYKADPNAITPQQARTAFARYCKKIDLSPGCQAVRCCQVICRAVRQLSGTVRCLCQTSCQVLSVLSDAVRCVSDIRGDL